MREAQEQFDRHLQPACRSQLTALVLHKVLSYPAIQPYILGGKGVGSQGDATAQLLAKDEECQGKVIEIFERELQMPCLRLALRAGRRVHKAVIPAAGFGTRLFPASKAMEKGLFPVVDAQGRAKPIIMVIVEEAVNAGIEEVCLMVQEGDLPLFEELFHSPPRTEHFNKLSRDDQRYSDYILELGHRVTFVPQHSQEGFDHAVYCAREWVKDEPFLLLLGDHICASDTGTLCPRQILEVHERVGGNVVGLKVTPVHELHKFGCVTGTWQEPNVLLAVTEFAEKPEVSYGREHLHVEGMDEDQLLTVFGQYALSPKIFDYLQENLRHNARERGEFQFTSYLDALRREEGSTGYVVKGRRFDIGNPEAYRQAVIEFQTA